MPGWLEGICRAPAMSQVAVRVIVTVCSCPDGPSTNWTPPGTAMEPESSTKLACPLAISAPAAVQPGGSALMQGRKAAEGTACAAKIMVWPVPQSGACAAGLLGAGNKTTPKTAGTAKRASIAAARLTRRTLQRCSTIGRRGQANPADAPALQHDRAPLRGKLAELGEQVAGIAFHEGAQLRRAGDPAGGGEGLGQLGLGEIIQRLPVYPRGVGADRENQHHVAQVDG